MEKQNGRILIVDDNSDILTTARVVLRQVFNVVDTEQHPARIPFLLDQHSYDVILLDMNFTLGQNNGHEGLYWLQQILSANQYQQVVMITAYGEVKSAVEAMKKGAADFIVKPWDNDQLEATVLSACHAAQTKKELHLLKRKQSEVNRLISTMETQYIGNSASIRRVLELINKVASTDANVLILGENGTGKDLVARMIHQRSLRAREVFVKVDAGALSPQLFESELFGHRKGAFTDAKEDRMGRIELANKGTLFLDEIGNIPSALQSRLLSVLQNREIFAVGSSRAVPVDIRVVSATNIAIHQAVKEGLFREDMLYRINTVEITIPPLRTRSDDVALLATHFLNLYSSKYKKDIKLSPEALRHLEQYHWPGNVRELQHVMERAVILSEDTVLNKTHFPFSQAPATNTSTDVKLDDLEKNAIEQAITKHLGNMSKVASELGIGRTTLYRKMVKYGITK